MYTHGWYQIAYERELDKPLTPLQFGSRALMARRTDDGDIGIFDATCPHRGAHLAYGGRLKDDAVTCPFHGLRIDLGKSSKSELCVRGYPTLTLGGMVFFRLSDREEPSIVPPLKELAVDHAFVNGPVLDIDTAIEVVAENGWDAAHFSTVHHLPLQPKFTTREGPVGQLISEGEFAIRRKGWFSPKEGSDPLKSTFQASAFSPGVVIASQVGTPPFNYSIITTAVPKEDESKCSVRVTLALPKSRPDNDDLAEALMQKSVEGLRQDQVIWEHLNLSAPSQLTQGPVDDLFRTFVEFCHRFGEPTDRRLQLAST